MTTTASPPSIAVDERSAASALGMSVAWLRKDRLGARTIPYYRMGKSVRYDLTRVREALSAVEEGGPKPKARVRAKAEASS